MQLVLDTKGLHLQKKDNLFQIKTEKGIRNISPGKLTSIAITNNVVIDSTAVVLAIKHQIPILFFDRIGKAQARVWSPYFASIATLRRQQIRFLDSTEATSWMVDLFQWKTEEQLINLQFLRRGRTWSSGRLSKAIDALKRQKKQFEPYRKQLLEECKNNLMGTEGTTARIYWQALGPSLPKRYSFNKRSRRPAEDHFNAALNYLYGMLYSVVESAVFAVGLDPHLGFLHQDEYTKPTLVFDLIEPFRSWLDLLLIKQCLQENILASFFTSNQHGIFLNKNGKAFIIPLFNDFMRQPRTFVNRESSNKNHIYFVAGLLAQRIRATFPA